MRVYDSLGKGELALDEMLEKCLADYYEAEEDNDIKIESSANILALWFFRNQFSVFKNIFCF